VATALLVGATAFAVFSSARPPVLRSLPDFALVAHDGSRVSRERLSGRAFVADFIFTRCGGACPAMTSQMARLQKELPPGTGLVSFTVDPVFDTPEVLARYAAAHGAGPGWLFVTGPESALHALATQGFKLAAMEVPPEERRTGDDGPFLHSSKLVLVDGRGDIRGYYDSESAGARHRLVRDAAVVGPYGVLPRLNAALNATAAVLLAFGYVAIRSGRRTAHRNCMLAALACSALFLTAYLSYHARVGSVRFPGEGLVRDAYLAILGTHTVLAAAVVPLILVAVWRALRGRFEVHRRVARWAFPVWSYVSVTGVIVFWMLYRL
jgi:putative membrane protein